MAVYPQLLLSAGGGIISMKQQADQEPNTATLLIGLGGTGIDCLRTIKTQVHSRLKPDDPEAIVPEYRHIRFLGVDTDRKSKGNGEEDGNQKADELLSLRDTEYFSIANAHIKKDLSNRRTLEIRNELNWLNWEHINAPDLSLNGAGGVRQVGRFMLMDKAETFMSKLRSEIQAAKTNLASPSVNIHIFSGLSGGTGSGTFLDVCYMVKSIAAELGSNATVFGYFFLPDVNLARIPQDNTKTREYIPVNGFAAMQELDYCMQLQHNGGKFVQTYQGHKEVEWAEPPVELCHLICATNADGDVREKAYEYAMNVTAEYVMDFLTKGSKTFNLSSQLSNFNQMVAEADSKKMYGTGTAYCVIGASCASLPLREVNTYLASQLFGLFSSINEALPTQADVENFTVATLGSGNGTITEVFNALLSELLEGVTQSFNPYPDDYKFLLQGDRQSHALNYEKQLAEKKQRIEASVKSMTDEQNAESLIGRVRVRLNDCVRDVERGPIYAHGMIAAARSHNLLNQIDGIIEQNQNMLDQYNWWKDDYRSAYENALDVFCKRIRRRLFDSDRKRFDDLEIATQCEMQSQLQIYYSEQMAYVLRTLREQVERMERAYYAKLERVTRNLVETFRENRDALDSENVTAAKDPFAIPLMSIKELKRPMDAQIESINVNGMFSMFMGELLDNDQDWLQEDEYRIARLVTSFFVEKAFGEYASRSITSFLRDKYQTTTDEALANKVYNDWMITLAQRARPLFYFNTAIWAEKDTAQLCFLSVPESSAPIKAAAERLHETNSKWEIKESALTDRIYIMSSAVALPLAAYNNCEAYERNYYTRTVAAGTHYYEGKQIPGMAFNDWRKLPLLTPQSLVAIERAPKEVVRIVESGQSLYERACSEGVLGEDTTASDYGTILKPSEASVARLKDAIKACTDTVSRVNRAGDVMAAQKVLKDLDAALNLDMEASDRKINVTGFKDRKRTIREDYFVIAPAHQMFVEEILDEIETLKKEAEDARAALTDRIDKVSVGGQAIRDYLQAIFTGVISYEGRVVMYHQCDDYGFENDITLSKFGGGEFQFGGIPPYQGYVSYMALDQDIKEEIRNEVANRINDDDPVVTETLEKLKGVFAGNRVNAWGRQAANFPEQDEIIDFIKQLRENFRDFMVDFGVE